MDESRWWEVGRVGWLRSLSPTRWGHGLGRHRIGTVLGDRRGLVNSVSMRSVWELSVIHGPVRRHTGLPLLHLLLLQEVRVRKSGGPWRVTRCEGRHKACLVTSLNLLRCIDTARVIETGSQHRVLITTRCEVLGGSHLILSKGELPLWLLGEVKLLIRWPLLIILQLLLCLLLWFYLLLLILLLGRHYLLIQHYRVQIASDLVVRKYCVLACWLQISWVLHHWSVTSLIYILLIINLRLRWLLCWLRYSLLGRCRWLLGLGSLWFLRNFDLYFFQD